MTMLRTSPTGNITAALHSDRPGVALGAEVHRLLDSGFSHDRVAGILREVRERCAVEHDEAAEDTVVEMLDVLNGWGPPAVLREYGLPAEEHVDPRI